MPNGLPDTIPDDPELWPDFLSLCAFGGRLTGAPGEIASRDFAAKRLAIHPGRVSREPTPYVGWTCSDARLLLPDGEPLEANVLLCCGDTPTEGLDVEVVDCGRGTPEDIRGVGARLAGRAALVRHDYMFGTDTVHRRLKLDAAIAAGAAAFLIAATEPGLGAVSGSAGLTTASRRIPGFGISAEAAARLTAMPEPRVRFHVASKFLPEANTETLILDLPGAGPDRVVLSAHIDGHAAGESALDNATGVALALSLARRLAPYVSGLPRGLTVCLFSAEEWALTGSKVWLGGLPEDKRRHMVLNLNLDTVTGGSKLTALTSGFTQLGAFVSRAAASAGAPLGVHLPLMSNSDHANFAALGMPALRLVSGFDEPTSKVRLLLTKHDTRDLVAPDDFNAPTRVAWAILTAALTAPADALAALRATD
jgi:aminopeptidase YwaD